MLVEGHNPVVTHQVCQTTRIPLPTSLKYEVRVGSQPSIAPLVVVIEMQQKHIQEKCIIVIVIASIKYFYMSFFIHLYFYTTVSSYVGIEEAVVNTSTSTEVIDDNTENNVLCWWSSVRYEGSTLQFEFYDACDRLIPYTEEEAVS